jgi:predicted negative regulator of RcsB-dependent stress response
MVPTLLEMGKFLFDKDLAADADSVLSYGAEIKEPALAFFLNLQRAVIQEKLGKTDEAIASLQKISGKDSFMPARVGVELGRLYLQKGDKGKAQSQLENVISTYPNDSEAKMAKLYLGQMSR